jgi:hypothetical protein
MKPWKSDDLRWDFVSKLLALAIRVVIDLLS